MRFTLILECELFPLDQLSFTRNELLRGATGLKLFAYRTRKLFQEFEAASDLKLKEPLLLTWNANTEYGLMVPDSELGAFKPLSLGRLNVGLDAVRTAVYE